jgi:hypothetical protein
MTAKCQEVLPIPSTRPSTFPNMPDRNSSRNSLAIVCFTDRPAERWKHECVRMNELTGREHPKENPSKNRIKLCSDVCMINPLTDDFILPQWYVSYSILFTSW